MTAGPPVYDRLAAHYDRALGPLEKLGLRRLRASLLGELEAGSRLLEVGAGTGANFPFYPPGATALACDPSREMLARAAARPERPAGVGLARCRAERLPFADATFDAAFATLVICSVESPAAALSELGRVVKPGGRVLLLEHVRPSGPLGPLFDALSLLTVPLCGDHFNRRTAEEARRAGLSVERVERRLFGVVQLIFCRAG
ncbi:MAG TPA: methyltransferase domain-containing protein [Pyrinomonadaceae bacterium]|nr:methyltransferase domain-containing protein [Pyrinomonadaceae bacterium]